MEFGLLAVLSLPPSANGTTTGRSAGQTFAGFPVVISIERLPTVLPGFVVTLGFGVISKLSAVDTGLEGEGCEDKQDREDLHGVTPFGYCSVVKVNVCT